MMLKRFSLASLIVLTSISYTVQADTLLQVYQAAKTKDQYKQRLLPESVPKKHQSVYRKENNRNIVKSR